MKNSSLLKAKEAKNDEFYTQYSAIEKEVNAYLEYNPEVFKNKTILLPCDDPEWSNFTKYFAQNFERFELKKLISTSYAAESKKYQTDYHPTFFEINDKQFDSKKTRKNGKIFILDHDKTHDGRVDVNDLEWHYLKGDGDFKSDEIKKIRDEADMIITNPPFSLFREFLEWIAQAEKQFLIIGSINAITYIEVLPLIKNNKIWLGNGFQDCCAYFKTPFANEYDKSGYDPKTNLVKFGNACWLTNIDHGRRHNPLTLMTMADNIKFSKYKEIRGKEYKKYDNYDAIEVPYVKAIPSDYDGVMGVPVSFLNSYCPEQFELLGSNRGVNQDLNGVYGRNSYINEKETFKRIFIKHKRVSK